MAGENLTADQIHLGSLAHKAFKDGVNPPGWAVDEDKWAKAKEAASKSYSLDDDAYWPVVVSIYENMGGTIQGDKSVGNEAAEFWPKNSVAVLGNQSEVREDGWALIPYGSWPHQDGLQKFDRGAAETIVSKFKSFCGRVKRAVTGMPIFNGHPDLAEQYKAQLALADDDDVRSILRARIAHLANQYPDKNEYGQIADMRCGTDGLSVKMVLSRAGAKLVEAGKKFISPNWNAEVVGWTGGSKNGPIWRPNFMNSIGLTSNPNIPVPSLVNSKQQKENTQMMPQWLLTLLGLANEATEDQVRQAVTALKDRPELSALANERTARTTAEGKATSLESENTRLKKEASDAQTALANERQSRVGDVVAAAIRAGKITEAEKTVWEKRLTANFAEESQALANEKVKVKTRSVTEDRTEEEKRVALANAKKKTDEESDDDGDEDDGMDKIKLKVNEEMAKDCYKGMSHANAYNRAFAHVKKSNPELFKAKAA